MQAARNYYSALCGWPQERVESPHGSYLAMALSREIGGGIVECGAPRAMWLPYVEVPCVDRATEHAQELGATVLLSPREGPAGWRSVITTPAGGELAFWRQKR
jgi:predicted enzyme related to lactoylglutathione lyase